MNDPPSDLGPAVALKHQWLELGVADFDQREFSSDKKAVQQHKKHHRSELQNRN